MWKEKARTNIYMIGTSPKYPCHSCNYRFIVNMGKDIIHDGLRTYDGAFQKEYFKESRVKNVRSISVRNQGLNSLVKRMQGTIIDRQKVMRGMQRVCT